MRALILKKVRYGESDLIVHFLLESGSRIQGFAAGARQSHKRYPHRFDLSGVYNVQVPSDRPSERLVRLQEVELLEYAQGLRRDLSLLTRWAMILEWVAQGELDFASLLLLRQKLDQGNLEAFHQFFWGQIEREGVSPLLNECSICHRPTMDSSKVFSPAGFVHSQCSPGVLLSPETLAWIESRNGSDLSEPFSSTILKELDQITVPYLQQQLERPLRAFGFFQQLDVESQPFGSAQIS